ncbi:MAG: hypothetical protein KC613_06195 [Myxococcales bacterium]|nr:hypothetical protein [Myxococcales bacterium]
MVLDACTPTILWIGAERPWRQLARSASPLAPSEQERLYAPDLAEAARLIDERARLGRPVAAAVISPDLARVADAAALAPLWALSPAAALAA